MLKLFRSTGLMFILTAFSLSVSLAEDEITISTYYPSPHGVYNKLQTDKLGIGDNDGDGNLTSADTPDETGNVWIAGKVGIGTGTTTPASALSVAGGIQLGDDAEGCTSAKNGTIRVHAGVLELCDGNSWKVSGGALVAGILGGICEKTANCVYSPLFPATACQTTLCQYGTIEKQYFSHLKITCASGWETVPNPTYDDVTRFAVCVKK